MWSDFVFGVLLPASLIALIVGLIYRSKPMALRSAALYFFIVGGIELSKSMKLAYALFITSLIILGSIYLFTLKKYNLYLATFFAILVLLILGAYVFWSDVLKSSYVISNATAYCMTKEKILSPTIPLTLKGDYPYAPYQPNYPYCTIEFVESYKGYLPITSPNYYLLINYSSYSSTYPLYPFISSNSNKDFWKGFKSKVSFRKELYIKDNFTEAKLCYDWGNKYFLGYFEYYDLDERTEKDFYKCLPIRISFKK